jgi:hypothetical protein
MVSRTVHGGFLDCQAAKLVGVATPANSIRFTSYGRSITSGSKLRQTEAVSSTSKTCPAIQAHLPDHSLVTTQHKSSEPSGPQEV